MSQLHRYRLQGSISADDEFKTQRTRDLSGGANTQLDSQDLPDDQAVIVQNVDIGVKGKRTVRPGLTLLEDLGDDLSIHYCGAFEPDGGTNALDVVLTSGSDTSIFSWPTAGSFAGISGSTASIASDAISFNVFKTGGDGDVRVFGSTGKNWIEIEQDGTLNDLGNTSATGSDSPPRSNVGTFYNSRMWVLKDNILYYSDALPNSYADTFDTQSTGASYNMPVGKEQFLIGVREKGLVCGGDKLIRYVIPEDTPEATDENGVFVSMGCVAGKTACLVGEDILYLAKDGVRGVFRTEFDTLQYKSSLPLSYPLKDQLALVNWAHIDKACAIYYDNKYFISLPISSSEVNNSVWVYYPATNGWMVVTGWSVSSFAQVRVNGNNYLYATSSTDGKVYRAWFGASDNGSDIAYNETHKKYDVGSPFETKTGGEV